MDNGSIAAIPLEDIDVSDPELYQTDSWRPYFERLRNEDPVHYCADSPYGPFWSVTRFHDIVDVDRNHEVFSAEPVVTLGDPPPMRRPAIENFIQMDPPAHDEHRRVVQPVVGPTNLARMEPLIRERAGLILDELPIGETFDWVTHVSRNLTSRMLATLFDFPQEDREKLIYWSDMFTDAPQSGGAVHTQEERGNAARECVEVFSRLFEERRNRSPEGTSDLLTMLAHGESTRDMLDRPHELLGTIILLVVGGNDTTRNSISGGVLGLNEYPGEYDKLRENPALVASMVPEIVRWQTPVLHIRRTLAADTELAGKQIKAGEKLVMWYISGNRDETAIDNAEAFVIDRPNPRHHLSFGFGIHRCMGNRLAEMQLRVLWEEIMQRFSFVEVVGEPKRMRSNLLRAINELPVRLHAA
jgi:cytochrome P450